MRVFSISFNGHYLGGFAVVVAEDKREARAVFKQELKKTADGQNLLAKNKEPGSIEITDIGIDWPSAHIQWNGDY